MTRALRISYSLVNVLALLSVPILTAFLIPHTAEAGGQQSFTTTGNTTFSVPAYTRRLVVEVWGAGGGGGGAGTSEGGGSGGGGNQSCFNGASAGVCTGGVIGGGGSPGAGSASNAGGGGGAGGTASGGDVNTSGSSGATGTSIANGGGDGGNPANRGGTGQTGSGAGDGGTPGGGGGGGGCAIGFKGGGGGGGAGYSRKTYAPGDISGTIHIVVGTGGTAGTAGNCSAGGAGARGEVRVTWDSVLINSASTISSNLNVIGSISKGSGSFVIDHPLDPENKLLYHSFVESPDLKNLYDGRAVLDENGEATIRLPDYFMALNRDFRYLATGIESPMPDLHLARGVRREWFFGAPTFRIAGGTPGGTISWQVTGIRKDAYALANPIRVEMDKGPDAIMGENTCIFEPLCEN